MKSYFSETNKKSTLSNRRRLMKILHVTLLVHVAVIFLPGVGILLKDMLFKKDKKDTIVVKLVELPKTTGRTVKKSGSTRPRRKVQRPKRRPAPKRTVKKTVPKKQPRPVKKAAPAAKTAPKTRKVTPVNSKTVSPRPEKKYTPPSPPDDLEVITSYDTRHVQEEEDDDEDGEVGATYAQQLMGIFYQLWIPPSRQLLQNRNPRVLVEVSFNRQGRVLRKRIIKSSGFKPMDDSVIDMLKKLTQVPPPPPGEPLSIEFIFVPQE